MAWNPVADDDFGLSFSQAVERLLGIVPSPTGRTLGNSQCITGRRVYPGLGHFPGHKFLITIRTREIEL